MTRNIVMDALKRAEQFIVNGVEYGYIRLPEPGDSALDTLPAIQNALAALSAAGGASLGVTDDQQSCACPQHGSWINAADVRRLVRELDVALNGEECAAMQAALVDIVAQVKQVARERGRPVLITTLPAEQPAAQEAAKPYPMPLGWSAGMLASWLVDAGRMADPHVQRPLYTAIAEWFDKLPLLYSTPCIAGGAVLVAKWREAAKDSRRLNGTNARERMLDACADELEALTTSTASSGGKE